MVSDGPAGHVCGGFYDPVGHVCGGVGPAGGSKFLPLNTSTLLLDRVS